MVSAVCSVCWVVVSNIVIGLYLLDMWSVLFVLCVGVVGSNIVIGLYHKYCTYRTCGQCCVFPYLGGGI